MLEVADDRKTIGDKRGDKKSPCHLIYLVES